MKYQIVLSEASKQDLENIWYTTAERWSIVQANKYYEILEEGIYQLCRTPEIGRVLNEISEEYRLYKVKSHLVIYRVSGRNLNVVRILHERMDKKSNMGK